MKFYVYTHCRPGPGHPVFYVGKGQGRRAFCFGARSKRWRDIVAKCGAPVVKLIGHFSTEQEAFDAEVEVIALLREMGADLANVTSGGHGASIGAMPPAQRAKIGAANALALRGRTLPDAVRAKVSATMTGRRLSDEHIARLTGRERSPSHRAALSAALRGNRNSVGAARTEAQRRASLNQATKPVLHVASGVVYASVQDAAQAVRPGPAKTANGNIVACCKGRLQQAYGSAWRYAGAGKRQLFNAESALRVRTGQGI